MIVKNELEQWVGCTCCGERIELRRKTMADAETMLLIVEHLAQQHRFCGTYADNPERATKLSREFRQQVREELRRIERASTAQV